MRPLGVIPQLTAAGAICKQARQQVAWEELLVVAGTHPPIRTETVGGAKLTMICSKVAVELMQAMQVLLNVVKAPLQGKPAQPRKIRGRGTVQYEGALNLWMPLCLG